jgi:hypothetical protein
VDGGFLVPCLEGDGNIFGDFLETCPIKIVISRKILLVAVAAPKIAEIGDMPLNME